MKKLSIKNRFLVSMTLFGMFFGAGNLIFPVHLGQLAGNNYLMATIGFIITAVSIPILAVAAIGITHSNGLMALSSKVSKKFAYFFTCLLYLTIGPLFAIPRCATTSYTIGISPFFNEDKALYLLIFSLIFFALVLYFSLKPSGITIWIGKIINPIFLIFLFILIIFALKDNNASLSTVQPIDTYMGNSLFNGFIEGYGTMDAIAGLAFGIVVINIIKQMGIKEDKDVASEVIKSGVITGLLMAFIYILTIIIGAKSRNMFDISANRGIALAQIANYYLKSFGSSVLCITITFACLKTSIGLVTSCAETFEGLFKGFSYKTWAIIFTLFSFIISNFGLNSIITYSIPVLMFIYPIAITLTLLALFSKKFKDAKEVYLCTISFTIFAAIFDLIKALPFDLIQKLNLQIFIDLATTYFPFYNLGLGFVAPSIIGLCLGLYLRKRRLI